MVGPSLSPSERAGGMRKLGLFVVGLVALSGALVPLYADATLAYVAAGALAGALVGFALWKYLLWTYRNDTSRRDESEESDFEKRERFK